MDFSATYIVFFVDELDLLSLSLLPFLFSPLPASNKKMHTQTFVHRQTNRHTDRQTDRHTHTHARARTHTHTRTRVCTQDLSVCTHSCIYTHSFGLNPLLLLLLCFSFSHFFSSGHLNACVQFSPAPENVVSNPFLPIFFAYFYCFTFFIFPLLSSTPHYLTTGYIHTHRTHHYMVHIVFHCLHVITTQMQSYIFFDNHLRVFGKQFSNRSTYFCLRVGINTMWWMAYCSHNSSHVSI